MNQMIKLEKGYQWNIDGHEMRFRYKKGVSKEIFGQMIARYCDLVRSGLYKAHPDQLCEAATVAGDIVLIRIGLEVFPNEFLSMFRHFVKRYIDQWEKSGRCVSIRRVNMRPVFDLMFHNLLTDRFDGSLMAPSHIPCVQCFKEIYEQEFAAFWVCRIAEKIQAYEPLYSISERIGTMLVSIYVCHLPDSDMIGYLERFARSFTRQRTIITMQSFFREILKPDFFFHRAGLDRHFMELADAVIQREYETQRDLFIRENHLQLDVNSDKWIIFSMKGPALSRTVIDFSGIKSPSLKREIQFFMKDRYYSFASYPIQLKVNLIL